jgi:hypothetical protein
VHWRVDRDGSLQRRKHPVKLCGKLRNYQKHMVLQYRRFKTRLQAGRLKGRREGRQTSGSGKKQKVFPAGCRLQAAGTDTGTGYGKETRPGSPILIPSEVWGTVKEASIPEYHSGIVHPADSSEGTRYFTSWLYRINNHQQEGTLLT